MQLVQQDKYAGMLTISTYALQLTPGNEAR